MKTRPPLPELRRRASGVAPQADRSSADAPAETDTHGEALGASALERPAALQESEELLRQLANNIPATLWIRDAGATTLRYINPAWEKMSGRTIAAGDSLHAMYGAFHPDDLEQIKDTVARFPNGGADLECRIVRPDGTIRWVHTRSFPITDPQGNVYRVAGFMNDITERREERQRIERLKDEFVSTVSHELRTPLTSIAGSLGLLVGNAAGALPEPAIRLLTIAHDNSQRLVRLIGDILDIEKIESGKVIYALERVDLRGLVQKTIEAMRGFAEGFDVRIRLDSAAVTGEVCADRDRLVQVFTNLISNAIKFSPPNGEVVIAIEKGAGTLKASIRDHGPGIPAEFRARVFEKFAQAHNTDGRQLGGTGLGLSIVQKIIQRLGGEVGFADAAGGGTIFHVALPTWDYLGRAKSILDGRVRSARILLCDGDPDVSAALSQRFQDAGFPTDAVQSAADAAKHAAETTYAAILVDLRRPRGDALRLIKQLRALPQARNMLLVAAASDLSLDTDNSKRATTLNILDWVDKPHDTDRLSRALDRLIVPGVNTRPRILHIDEDPGMIHTVASTLGGSADIVSAESTEAARHTMTDNQFDAVVLNLARPEGSGLQLLFELRNSDGDALPVVILSAQRADAEIMRRIQETLSKSPASTACLIARLRRHLAGQSVHAPPTKDAAA